MGFLESVMDVGKQGEGAIARASSVTRVNISYIDLRRLHVGEA